MSRPASPASGAPPSPRPQPFTLHDLGDPEIILTSPLSPPLPIPPPPSRRYTDELSKKSVPVDPTPVIRLLAPTPEATSPRILLRPRRPGFVDEDEEKPFPSFFHPSMPPGGRFDSGGVTSSAGLPDPVPWTDELTRQRRRQRRPSYAQSVWEEDTSSSSSSSSSAMSSDDESGVVTQRETGDADQTATTRKVESRTEGEGGVEDEEAEPVPSAAQDITTFRFPGATA